LQKIQEEAAFKIVEVLIFRFLIIVRNLEVNWLSITSTSILMRE
jgi:hypothetical protein